MKLEWVERTFAGFTYTDLRYNGSNRGSYTVEHGPVNKYKVGSVAVNSKTEAQKLILDAYKADLEAELKAANQLLGI